MRRPGAAVRPTPAREGDRKRPCSPRLHRARELPGSGRTLRRPSDAGGTCCGGGVPSRCLWAREVTAPGVRGPPEAAGTESLWKEGNFRNNRLKGILGTMVSKERQGSQGRAELRQMCRSRKVRRQGLKERGRKVGWMFKARKGPAGGGGRAVSGGRKRTG